MKRVSDKPFLHQRLHRAIRSLTVVLLVGGQSKRMGTLPQGMHKAFLPLPGGATMASLAVDMYSRLGIRRFALLAKEDTKDSSLVFLSHMKKRAVSASLCVVPQTMGRGAALRWAVLRRHIRRGDGMIIHNPDDVILGTNSAAMMTTAISRHLNFEEEGAVATLLSVEGTTYPFSSFQEENNRVVHIERNAFVPFKTHIGVTICSPKIIPLVLKKYRTDTTTDFEETLFPELCAQGRLYLTTIPADSWIAVNDLKSIEHLRRILAAHNSRKRKRK